MDTKLMDPKLIDANMCGVIRKYNIFCSFCSSYSIYFQNGNIIEGELCEYNSKLDNLVENCNFINNIMCGEFKTYYENGNVETETNYTNGKLNGLQRYYDTNGQLEKKKYYIDGKICGKYKQ